MRLARHRESHTVTRAISLRKLKPFGAGRVAQLERPLMVAKMKGPDMNIALKTTAAAAALTCAAGLAFANPDLNVVENASATDTFSTLVTAIEAAGLADDLMLDNNRYTVFAPTNAAFDALPAGTVEDLLKPENADQLKALLSAHVVPALVDFSAGQVNEEVGTPAGTEESTVLVEDAILQVNTLADAEVLIDLRTDVPMISTNEAGIENAIRLGEAIVASNGIIHPIDKVLSVQ